MLEYRWAEFRREGRALAGTLIAYGDTARIGRDRFERFEPGSMRFGDVSLNLMHDSRRVLTTTQDALELTDSAERLEVRAELPGTRDADDALELVDRGVLRGLSSEFHALSEHDVGNTRIVSSALLTGIGVVDAPAYVGSTVERRNSIGELRGAVPLNKRIACECHRGGPSTVQFAAGAFEQSLRAAAAGERNILAIMGDTKAGALASTATGSLKLRERNGRLQADIDIPDTNSGRDLRELVGTVPVLTRPLFNQDESEFTERDGIAIYSSVFLRAILVGATSNDAGWAAATFAAQAPARRRRTWL